MHRNAEEPCATRVWWRTPSVLSPFRRQDVQQHAYPCVGLPYPISDTNTIIHCARRLLNQSYRRDFLYKRTGVYVGEVVPKDAVTKDLFEEPETEPVSYTHLTLPTKA